MSVEDDLNKFNANLITILYWIYGEIIEVYLLHFGHHTFQYFRIQSHQCMY